MKKQEWLIKDFKKVFEKWKKSGIKITVIVQSARIMNDDDDDEMLEFDEMFTEVTSTVKSIFEHPIEHSYVVEFENGYKMVFRPYYHFVKCDTKGWYEIGFDGTLVTFRTEEYNLRK